MEASSQKFIECYSYESVDDKMGACLILLPKNSQKSDYGIRGIVLIFSEHYHYLKNSNDMFNFFIMLVWIFWINGY